MNMHDELDAPRTSEGLAVRRSFPRKDANRNCGRAAPGAAKRRYFDTSEQANDNEKAGSPLKTNVHKRAKHEPPIDESVVEGSITDTSTVAFRELKEYLSSLVVSLQEDEVSADDRAMLFENCIGEISGNEVFLYRSSTSRFVETLFRLSGSQEAVLKFFEATVNMKTEQLIDIACNTSGSHLLETVLRQFAESFVHKPLHQEDARLPSCSDLLVKFARDFVAENFETLLFDSYGSHVLRTTGCVLLGQLERLEPPKTPPVNSEKQTTKQSDAHPAGLLQQLPESLRTCYDLLAAKIFDWSALFEHFSNESVSLVLQEFIVLDRIAGSQNLNAFLKSCFSTDSFAMIVTAMWSHAQASRVWERIVQNCAEKQRRKLIKFVIKDRPKLLIQDKCANFVIQRLLDSIESQRTASKMVKTLGPIIETCVASSTTGVLSSLIGMCSRLRFLERELTEALCVSFTAGSTTTTPDNKHGQFLHALLRCQSGAGIGGSRNTHQNELEVSYFGSVLVQKLLTLSDTALVVDAILSLSAAELAALSCHQFGGFVMTAFAKEPNISVRQKSQLLQKLQGQWTEVACDKYGSRLLDSIWAHCPAKDKQQIARELSAQLSRLLGDRFGRFAARNWSLQNFVRNQKQWLDVVKRMEKQRRLLSDILVETK